MGTLYLTEQGSVVTKTGERLLVRKDGKLLHDLPALHVDQIVVFGNAGFTTPAVRYVLENGIDVAYLSSRGNYRGRLQPAWGKDASLRQQQYRRSLDAAFCLQLAQAIVAGKIRNTVAFCRRQRRLSRDSKQRSTAMEALLPKIATAVSIEQLMGYEGTAAATYYRVFRTFMKTDLGFQGRHAHPPTDPVNALLSLGYTLLYNQLYAAINVVGLDPYQGFFHQHKHGHAALASDLMEEWRAIIVDSIVLTVINRREIKQADFHQTEQGWRLTKEALTRFLKRYDARVSETVWVPAVQGKTPYRRSFELQVRQLGRVIGEQQLTYQPFQLQ
jgi:CRISPR-associated protein Cas1